MSWQSDKESASQSYIQGSNPYQTNSMGGYAKPALSDATIGERTIGPGIALIILGILGALVGLVWVGYAVLLFSAMASAPAGEPEVKGILTGTGLVVTFMSIVFIISQAVMIYGGVCFMQRKNYPFAMAASIISIVPLCNFFCLFNVPFGIWGLVVLADHRVKESFE